MLTDYEKNQIKILNSDYYALQNIEVVFPDEVLHSDSKRLHVKALGNSMVGAGIFADDLLIIDRCTEAKHGHIILALIYGKLTLKRFHFQNCKAILLPENSEYKSITVTSDSQFKVIGVLTYNIHKHI